MGLLDRFRRRTSPRSGAGSNAPTVRGTDEPHLRNFIRSRRGVEGFVEPQTTVTPVTLLLVAHDGEWTRRAVPSVKWAHSFCNAAEVPSYDAAVVGIPQRMREYNRSRRSR